MTGLILGRILAVPKLDFEVVCRLGYPDNIRRLAVVVVIVADTERLLLQLFDDAKLD